MKREIRNEIKYLLEFCEYLEDAYIDLIENAFPDVKDGVVGHAKMFINCFDENYFIANYSELAREAESIRVRIKKNEEAKIKQ